MDTFKGHISHYTSIPTAKIKKTDNPAYWGENMEKLELSYIVGGNVTWYKHLGKRSDSFFYD